MEGQSPDVIVGRDQLVEGGEGKEGRGESGGRRIEGEERLKEEIIDFFFKILHTCKLRVHYLIPMRTKVELWNRTRLVCVSISHHKPPD